MKTLRCGKAKFFKTCPQLNQDGTCKWQGECMWQNGRLGVEILVKALKGA